MRFCRHAWTVYKHIAGVYVKSHSYRFSACNSGIEMKVVVW